MAGPRAALPRPPGGWWWGHRRLSQPEGRVSHGRVRSAVGVCATVLVAGLVLLCYTDIVSLVVEAVGSSHLA